jgi:hypothetical protein
VGKPVTGLGIELDDSQSNKQPTTVISVRLLGVIFAAVLVVILGLYDSRISHYPAGVTLFPRVIGLPTLVLAIAYLVKELVKLAKSTQNLKSTAENSNVPKVTVPLPSHEQPTAKESVELLLGSRPINTVAQTRIVGLGLAVGLAVLYVALLGVVGFLIDSIALVVGGPLLFGQPIRAVPVLLVAGTALAVILSVLIHLSGVIPLSTGIFHIGVS